MRRGASACRSERSAGRPGGVRAGVCMWASALVREPDSKFPEGRFPFTVMAGLSRLSAVSARRGYPAQGRARRGSSRGGRQKEHAGRCMIGWPSKSLLSRILVEKPLRDPPKVCPSCQFLAPQAESWARATVYSILRRWGVAAQGGRRFKEQLEHAGLARPPEPLPNPAPWAELGRQSPPGDVVNGEAVHGLGEPEVVAHPVALSRSAGVEYL